jgi:hypothetical protein
MATYDHPVYVTYNYEGHDFGAGGATKPIVGPAGMRGKIVDIHASNVTETFTNTTTEAKVQAGVSGELDKFADFGLGTLAAGAADAATRHEGDVTHNVLGSDETLLLTFVAPTGGTPAGIADVQVVVAWFN